ncbi:MULTISPECIES: hypothetical protein [Tenacibaculum]|uniref:hypothetical protein n=1 Tax=Tenacibaculum TaxID=104267 RepID=UPI000896E6FF|nr:MULTISPECIES: hypothetical protein [unclassified Tenacibaculum]SEE00005.1 hypothetical protein SAMN04487765_1060 [Tenacibaculum sp. MAR_2010_89]
MKNLRKIIALFLLIFITGIIVTVISINTSFKKNTSEQKITSKDSIYLLKKNI